jgi:putative FmdB family regulatory protein
MPVYEYQCNACGHAFEEWQKIKDAPVKVCPKCSQEAVERLISQTAFQLKGGGWYKDLYSSGKPKADAAKSSSGDTAKADGGGDKGGGSEKKTESKPGDSGKGGGSGASSGSSGGSGGSGSSGSSGGSGSSGSSGGTGSSGGSKSSASATG